MLFYERGPGVWQNGVGLRIALSSELSTRRREGELEEVVRGERVQEEVRGQLHEGR